jgi:hypothetical protein
VSGARAWVLHPASTVSKQGGPEVSPSPLRFAPG